MNAKRRKEILSDPEEVAKRMNGTIGQRMSLLRMVLEELEMEPEMLPESASGELNPTYIGLNIVAEMLDRQRKVDHREYWLMKDYLSGLGMEIAHLHTGEGDVSSRRVSIERKEDDLLSSLFDNRRLRQLGAMREEAEFSFVVITKSWSEVKKDAAERGVSDRTLLGYIASMCAVGYPPLFIEDRYDASLLMTRIVDKIEDDVPRLFVARPSSPKAVEYRNAIVEALPKVGAKTRRRLTAVFPSISDLCNATIEELMEVEGVGKATAERIHEILHTRPNR